MISIICAKTSKGVIGKDNSIPWHIPEDLKKFKEITLGKPVIMGRKTFISVIEFLGKPLPGRINIVLTRNTDFTVSQYLNSYVVNNAEQALDLSKKFISSENNNEIIIAGGEQIYKIFMPLANRMYLSIIKKEYLGNVYFPKYDKEEWSIMEQQDYKDFTFKIIQK